MSIIPQIVSPTAWFRKVMELGFTLIFILVSFPLLAVPTATECGVKRSSSRIVGGRDSGGYHYPWFALLVLKQNQDIPICAGSLITQNHILTAAHCFNLPSAPKKDLYNVLMGIYNRCNHNEPTRQLFGVSRVFVHEEYNRDKKFHDIALMVLDRPADYTLICLPQPGAIDGTEPAVLIGFGVTKEGGKEAPCHMMEAHIAKYSKKECERSDLPEEDKKEQSVICAGRIRGGTDSCQGDSGGPLQTVTQDGKFVIAGIVSYGYGCANPGLPGLYTNVASYLAWIGERISVGKFHGKGNETLIFQPSEINREDKHTPGAEVIFPGDGTGRMITDRSVGVNFPGQISSDYVRDVGGTPDRPSTVVFPD